MVVALTRRKKHATKKQTKNKGYLVNWDLERDIWARGLRSLSAAAGAGGADLASSSAGLVLTEPLFNFPAVQAATEEVKLCVIGLYVL